MLTPTREIYQLQSLLLLRLLRAKELGTPPVLGLLLPLSRPHSRASSREGPWLRSFSSFPSPETSCSAPPNPKNKSAKKMWEGASSVLHLGSFINSGSWQKEVRPAGGAPEQLAGGDEREPGLAGCGLECGRLPGSPVCAPESGGPGRDGGLARDRSQAKS